MKTFKEFKEIINFIKRGPERKGYYIKGVPKARVDKPDSAQVSKPRKGSWNDRQLKMTNEGVASLAIKGGSKLIPALMTGIGAAGTIMQSKGKFGKDAPQTRKGLKNIAKNVDKNKLEPDTASDREELIAKSKPEVKNIVDKEIKKDQGLDKILDKIRNRGKKPFKEEVAIANSMGGGAIAGSVEAGDNPPVRKKKPPMLRRKTYAKGGVRSRKPWLDYLKNK